MAELNYSVDRDDANEATFDPIPAGQYLAIITDSDLLPTSTGKGQYLKLVYKIIDGPLKGRLIFENLNLVNQNKQAEAISRRALNAIGAAVDVSHIDDSAQLHNIPLIIDVGMQNSEQYGMQNKIKKHLPANDGGSKKNMAVNDDSINPESDPLRADNGGGNDEPWKKKKGGLKS